MAHPTPVLVNSLSPPGVSSVFVGASVTCAIRNDTEHTLWCWGLNESGDLGIGATGGGAIVNANLPTQLFLDGSPLTNVASVAIGKFAYTACAVMMDGGLDCWGNDITTGAQQPSPVASVLKAGVSKVAIGGSSACAIVFGGVWCWGNDVTGNGSWINLGTSVDPFPIPSLDHDVIDISMNDGTACALTNDNNIHCWGFNTVGQLGNNGATDNYVPRQLPWFP